MACNSHAGLPRIGNFGHTYELLCKVKVGFITMFSFTLKLVYVKCYFEKPRVLLFRLNTPKGIFILRNKGFPF